MKLVKKRCVSEEEKEAAKGTKRGAAGTPLQSTQVGMWCVAC
jgi:hypothetical protein